MEKPILKKVKRLMRKVGYQGQDNPLALASQATLINLIAEEAETSHWFVHALVDGEYKRNISLLLESSGYDAEVALAKAGRAAFSAVIFAPAQEAEFDLAEASACTMFPVLRYFLTLYKQTNEK